MYLFISFNLKLVIKSYTVSGFVALALLMFENRVKESFFK